MTEVEAYTAAGLPQPLTTVESWALAAQATQAGVFTWTRGNRAAARVWRFNGRSSSYGETEEGGATEDTDHSPAALSPDDAANPANKYATVTERAVLARTAAHARAARRDPPVLTFYHLDVLGSVRAITDAEGDTVTRHDYFAFGESTSSLDGDPRRYLGQ